MGGTCSKKSDASNKKSNPYAKSKGNGVDSYCNKPHISSTQQVKERIEKKELQEANLKQRTKESFLYAKNDVGDEFYDGIPRYPSSSIKSRSIRRQAAVAKVKFAIFFWFGQLKFSCFFLQEQLVVAIFQD
jgi:hypothetical protein